MLEATIEFGTSLFGLSSDVFTGLKTTIVAYRHFYELHVLDVSAGFDNAKTFLQQAAEDASSAVNNAGTVSNRRRGPQARTNDERRRELARGKMMVKTIVADATRARARATRGADAFTSAGAGGRALFGTTQFEKPNTCGAHNPALNCNYKETPDDCALKAGCEFYSGAFGEGGCTMDCCECLSRNAPLADPYAAPALQPETEALWCPEAGCISKQPSGNTFAFLSEDRVRCEFWKWTPSQCPAPQKAAEMNSYDEQVQPSETCATSTCEYMTSSAFGTRVAPYSGSLCGRTFSNRDTSLKQCSDSTPDGQSCWVSVDYITAANGCGPISEYCYRCNEMDKSSCSGCATLLALYPSPVAAQLSPLAPHLRELLRKSSHACSPNVSLLFNSLPPLPTTVSCATDLIAEKCGGEAAPSPPPSPPPAGQGQPCVCRASSWSASHDDNCRAEQTGCPTVPCDGDPDGAWCAVEDAGCIEARGDEQDWFYCGQPPPPLPPSPPPPSPPKGRGEPCVCAASWTRGACATQEEQNGCPAVACDGDAAGPWCAVENEGCNQGRGPQADWFYCSSPPPPLPPMPPKPRVPPPPPLQLCEAPTPGLSCSYATEPSACEAQTGCEYYTSEVQLADSGLVEGALATSKGCTKTCCECLGDNAPSPQATYASAVADEKVVSMWCPFAGCISKAQIYGAARFDGTHIARCTEQNWVWRADSCPMAYGYPDPPAPPTAPVPLSPSPPPMKPPTAPISLGEGNTESAYGRAFFAVTLEELSLEAVVSSVLKQDVTLPFSLPTLKDVQLVLAKTLPCSDDEYDPATFSPEFLPEAARIASKDGLWFSTKIVLEGKIQKIIVCAIAGVVGGEFDFDGECDTTTLTVTAHLALPKCDGSGGGLADSWVRLGFPGMDLPDMPDLPDWGGATLPDLPEGALPSFDSSSLQRFSFGLDGNLVKCGLCGFTSPKYNRSRFSWPSYGAGSNDASSSPPPPTPSPPPRSANNAPSFLPEGLLDQIFQFAFPQLYPDRLPQLKPLVMTGLAGGAASGARLSAESSIHIGNNDIDLHFQVQGLSAPDIDGVALLMEATADFGDGLFGIEALKDVEAKIAVVQHFTDLTFSNPIQQGGVASPSEWDTPISGVRHSFTEITSFGPITAAAPRYFPAKQFSPTFHLPISLGRMSASGTPEHISRCLSARFRSARSSSSSSRRSHQTSSSPSSCRHCVTSRSPTPRRLGRTRQSTRKTTTRRSSLLSCFPRRFRSRRTTASGSPRRSSSIARFSASSSAAS